MKRYLPSINPYVVKLHEYPDHILPFIGDEIDASGRDLLEKRLGEYDRFVCELGCGSGNHLIACAARAPDVLHLGFELRFKRTYKTALKAARAGLGNVLVLRTSAERLLEFLPPHSMDVIHVNFPEPWNDGRYRERRLLGADNLRLIHRALVPAGLFRLKTDHPGYFDQVRTTLADHSDFDLLEWTENLDDSRWAEDNIQTEFETMFRRIDAPIRCLEARSLTGDPAPGE